MQRAKQHVITGSLATLAIAGVGSTFALAASDVWRAGFVGDYTTPGNWVGGSIPNGAAENAVIDGNGSKVAFSATVTLNDLDLGQTSGAPTFDQTSGSLTATRLRFGGPGFSRSPVYNLTGGNVSVGTFAWGNGGAARFKLLGSGAAATVSGSAFSIGVSQDSNGAIDIAAGTFDHTGTGTISLGTTGNGVGSIILSGGTFNKASGSINLGTANTAKGNITMSGGTFNAGNGSIGLGTGGTATGTISMTGGTFNTSTNTLRIGAQSGTTGNISLSGDAVFNATAASGTIYLGNNGGTGNLTLAGTSQFNAAGHVLSVGQFGNTLNNKGTVTMTGGTLRAQRISLGGDNAASNMIGTIDLNGGVIETGQIRKYSSAVVPTATANYVKGNGGTIRAIANAGNASFFDVAYVSLEAGGLTFDTNGNAVGINNAMQGVGALTKTGTGTLTLTGANAYTGGTTVTNGTLRLGASNALADTGTLTLSGGTLDADAAEETLAAIALGGATGSILQFGAADNTPHTLTFNDIGTLDGTLNVTNWSRFTDALLFTEEADALAVASATTFTDAYGIPGTTGAMVHTRGPNAYEVIAVPEPTGAALLGLGVGYLMQRRRRRC